MTRQREWQRKQVSIGKCKQCGRPRERLKQLCDTCMRKRLDKMALNRRTAKTKEATYVEAS